MTEDSRVPEELDAAMRRALDDNPSPTATEVLEAAERLLDRVLSGECQDRSSALDLLTVDAVNRKRPAQQEPRKAQVHELAGTHR